MREDLTLRSSTYLWRTLLFGFALGLALLLGTTAHVAAQEGGTMAVDCEGNSLAIETDCEFGDGQEFTVAIHITSAPAGGYTAFQMKLPWDGDVLDYVPTDGYNEEAVWPGCTFAARSDNWANLPDRPFETSFLFACFPSSIVLSSYEGPILLFTFACIGQGSATLALVPREDDPQQEGSHFVDENSSPKDNDPSLEEASVTCGGPAVERPETEITIRPAGAGTPLPDESPVTPGGPTATPGGPTTTPDGDDGTPVPDDNGDDGDDDGGGLPVWGWVLIGLAIAVGAGGVGFVAWRRWRSRGEST